MKILPCRVMILLFVRERISDGGVGISSSGFDARIVRTDDSNSWAERKHFEE